MGQGAVQNQVQEMEARLRRLERAVGQQLTPKKTLWSTITEFCSGSDSQSVNRMLGWGIVTLSALGFLSNITNQSVVYLLIISSAVGIWLIVQASGVIEESDSARILAHQERAGTAPTAHHTHVSVHVPNKHLTRVHWGILSVGTFVAIAALTYSITASATSLQQQTMIFLILFVLGAVEVIRRGFSKPLQYLLIVACYLTILMMPSLWIAVTVTLLITAAVLIYSWEAKDATLRTFAIAAALYLTQIWLVPSDALATTLTELIRFLSGLILSAAAIIPFLIERRTLKDQDVVRTSLVVGASGLLLTLLSSSLRDFDFGWILSLGSTGLVLTGLSGFAWIHNQRLSYAKHLLTLALASWFLCFYIAFSSSTTTLLLLIVGVAVIAVGFTLPSYSARLVGLGALTLAVLNYLLILLPEPLTYSGSPLMQERVWVGITIAVFLPVLAHWYALAKVRGIEQLLIPTITLASYSLSFMILFSVIYLDATSVAQTLLWLVLSLVGMVGGSLLRLRLLTYLGAATFIISFLTVAFSTNPDLSILQRIMLLLVIGIILLVVGFSFPRFRRLQ